jgi:antitoxin component YwqK of YwqJK toxin-antitoxin module
MKKSIIYITSIFFLMVIYACDSDKKHKGYYPNGALKYESEEINGVLNGIYKEYHANGILKFKGQFKNGLLEGKSYTYNNKGKLIEEKEWHKGKLNGIFKSYYDNNQIKQTYKSVMGKIEDTLRYFYSNGNIEGKTPYLYGYKNGKAIEYYETGELKHIYYWGRVDTTYGILWYKEFNKDGTVANVYHDVDIESSKVSNSDTYLLKIKLNGADHEKITVYLGSLDENYHYLGGQQDTLYSNTLETTYLYNLKKTEKNIIRGVIRDWKETKNPNGGKSISESFAYFTFELKVK